MGLTELLDGDHEVVTIPLDNIRARAKIRE